MPRYDRTMPRSRLVVAACAAAVLAIGAYFAFRPSDEARIRAMLGTLAKEVRVTGEDQNPIGRLAHVNDAFSKLFDRDVRVSIPEITTLQSGRRELAELTVGAPRFVRTLDVDFDDITIKLDDAHTSALVGATARIRAVERDGETRSDKRAVDFRFAKEDGEWRIGTLTVWAPGEARP
jgi:hypothetical protein